jgi:sugar lactone lactonase YvrE
MFLEFDLHSLSLFRTRSVQRPSIAFGAIRDWLVGMGMAWVFLGYGPWVFAQTASYVPSWVQQTPSASPPARYAPAMTEDGLGNILLFGGLAADDSVLADTWLWDGAGWTQKMPAHSPPARYFAGIAYHAASGKVVLFGGTPGSTSYLNDTWVWDGVDWMLVLAATPPPARDAPAMAASADGRLVMFGGADPFMPFLHDTWTWDGMNWSERTPVTAPSGREGGSMTYLVDTGQVVLFGGQTSSGYENDTWTWDGANWTQLAPAMAPAARELASIAYSAAGQALLFGGYNGSVAYGDTWAWNGSNWIPSQPLASPSARVGMGLAATPRGLMLFGGFDGSSAVRGDTWVLQPTAVDLGTANVCPGTQMTPVPCSSTATLAFRFGSAGTIGNPAVLTQGAAGLDFVDARTGTCTSNGTSHSYSAGDSCTVTVVFAPQAPGPRTGAVELLNSGGAVIATAWLSGTGMAPLAVLAPGTIATMAGDGVAAYAGDGGLATSAALNLPGDAVVDAAGNMYVADTGNNRIRKVLAGTGVISTLAGTGASGFSGDGGPATAASLAGPSGMALDGAGNLYFADTGNQRVRRIAASTGIVTTVAGSGATAYGGDGGVATRAALSGPAGVAVDRLGNVYIADTGNERVRMVAAATGQISTVAGNGSAGFSGDGGGGTAAMLNSPVDVAVDGAGNVFIADQQNQRIRRLAPGTHMLTTVAGSGSGPGFSGDGGSATSAQLNLPSGVTVDAAGDLYLADQQNVRVRRVSAGTGTISTIAGSGSRGFSGDAGAATGAALNRPGRVHLDGAGNLFLVDTSNDRIRKVSASANALGFTATQVGTTSSDSPQTVMLSNIGNAPLTFSVPGSGYNPGISLNFGYGNSSTCPQQNSMSISATLAPGASCTEQVSFTPIQAGAVSGTLVTTDDSSNATSAMQAVALSGNGAAIPTMLSLALAPSSGVLAGQTVVLSATISPSIATGTIVFSDNGVAVSGPVVPVNGTASYTLSPIAAGLHSFSAVFTASGPYLGSIASGYTLTVGAQPTAYVLPTTSVGSISSTQAVTLLFGADATLAAMPSIAIQALTLGRANFDFNVVAGGTCAANASYRAGQTCTVVVDFAPKSAGERLGAVVLLNSAATPVPVASVYLSGLALGSEAVFQADSISLTPTAVATLPSTIRSLALDEAGNIWVSGDSAIYRVSAGTGAVTMVASNVHQSQGIQLDGAGNVFFGSLGDNIVYELVGGVGAPVAIAPINGPNAAMAMDPAGNLYVYSGATGFVTKIAVGSHAVSNVVRIGDTIGGILFDAAGNLFFTGSGSQSSQLYELAAGAAQPTVYASGGFFGGNGSQGLPQGMAMDPGGNLYVAFAAGSTGLAEVAGGTRTQSALAGSSTPMQAVAIDHSGDLYSSSPGGNTIFKLARSVSTALTFADTPVGSSTVRQTVGVVNNGNATLNFSAVAFSTGYTLQASSTGCSTASSLAPAAGCTLGIAFAPPTYATFAGTITLTEQDSATSQIVPLVGNGLANIVALTAGGVADYGSATVPLIATLGYSGPLPTGALSLQVDLGPSLAATCDGAAPVETCSVVYPAASLLPGSHSLTAALAADNAYGSTSAAGLVAILEPGGAAPTTAVGSTSATQTVTVFFPSATTLAAGSSSAVQVLTQGLAGFDFQYVAGGTCLPGASYAAGASCTVLFNFSPRTPGLRQGSVVVDNAASVAVATVMLHGLGTGPLASYTPGIISSQGTGLRSPNTARVDAAGNLYVADTDNHRIVRIAADTGLQTVVAGTGVQSLSATAANGDGGPATSATLSYPQNVALDGAGNVYITDTGDNRVRRVDAITGIMTTVGGNGLGSGAHAVGQDSGDNGPAVNATMDGPDGIVIDAAGNLLVSDIDAGRIRKISGGVITTYAGTVPKLHAGDGGPATSAGIDGPANLSFDAAGNLYVAEYYAHYVRRISASGQITTVAGIGFASSAGDGGLATAAALNKPNDVAVDAAGNLYIAEGNRIREVLASTGLIATIAGDGNAGFTGDAGPATSASISSPQGVTLDAAGNLWIADTNNGLIRKVTVTAAPLSFATTAVGSTSSDSPKTVLIANDGNTTLHLAGQSATANFVATGGTCPFPGTLTAGFACMVGAAFSPQTTGGDTGNLNITDDTLNGPASIQQVQLFGVAVSGPATHFQVSAPAATAAAASFNVVVTAQDASGNTATSYTGMVHFSSSDPAAVLLADSALTLGTASFPITLNTPGTQTVSLADTSMPSIHGASDAIAVGAVAPTIRFLVSNHTFGDAAFPVSATSNSAGAFTYTVLSGPATIQGNLVTLIGAGAVVLQANEAADGIYASGSQTAGFTVAMAAPSLVFRVADHTFGDAPFAVAATSNSSGAFSYSVVSGPATVIGSTVSLTGAGGVVLKVTQAADANYIAAAQTGSFNVALAIPTITFAVPNHTYGDGPFAVSAASNSAGAITYSVVSGPATVSGSIVRISGSGTVVLKASQAADSDYTASSQIAGFAVTSAIPTISFPLASHVYGDLPFVVSATSNSTGTIAYSLVSGPATISGNMVTLTAIGLVTLRASQAADANFNAGTQVASFVVSAASPTLKFNPIANHLTTDPPITVLASSASAGVVTYRVVNGPASVVGNVVTLAGTVGTVVVQAVQAASGDYGAALAQTSFVVNSPSSPVIGFSVSNHTFGDAPFPVLATSTSSGAFTYAVVSGPAIIVGNIVTLTGAGTVVLQASQVASGAYAAGIADSSFTVAAIAPSLSFAVGSHIYGDAPFAVAASSNSAGSFTYAVVSGPATWNGTLLTLSGVGTVVLQATEVAAGNYLAASRTCSFQVGAATPTIIFNVANHVFGDGAFAVAATSNSTGAFSYIVVSGPATLAGNLVKITGTGSVVVQASQAADSNYIALARTATFSVGTATPTLTFSIANHVFGDPSFTVSASSNSVGLLTYSVVSGPATIMGNRVSIPGAGNVVVQASQSPAGNYGSATATASFTVDPAIPTLVFAPVSTHLSTDPPFAISASSVSAGAVVYAVFSGPAAVSGSNVTLTGAAGTVLLKATQSAAGNYAAAFAETSFAVDAPLPPTIHFSVLNHTFGDAPFAVAASSNSAGAFTYQLVSGPASILAGNVTLTGVGIVVLQASQAASGIYAAATSQTSFVVAALAPSISFVVAGHAFGDAAFALLATSNSPGTFSYALVSGPANLAGNTISITGAGMVVVQATQAAMGNYASLTQTTSFLVAPLTPVLVFAPIPTHLVIDAPFPVSATSLSGAPIRYSVVRGPATIVGSLITLTGAGGVVVIQATQPAGGNYNGASAQTSFQVNVAVTPTLSFFVPNHTYGDPAFSLAATSDSPAAFSYSIVSGPVQLSGSTVTLLGAGVAVLEATQPATGGYSAGARSATFLIAAAAPTLGFAIQNHRFGDPAFSIAATSNAPGTIQYAIVSGAANVSGTTLTLTGSGPVVVSATQSASANYLAATITATFNVTPETPSLTLAIPQHRFGDPPFAVAATSTSPAAMTYAVVSGPATMAQNVVTLTGAGNVTLIATQAAQSPYTGASAQSAFNVSQATPTIVWPAPAAIVYGAALGAAQLNAAASGPGGLPLAGTFVYTPAVGFVADPGIQTLTVSFTPFDTTDYVAILATTTLTVSPGVLTIAANDATRVYGTPNPAFTGTSSGEQNGDVFTLNFTTSAIPLSDVGTYPILPSASGPHLANYTQLAHNGTLTLTAADATGGLTPGTTNRILGVSNSFVATLGSTTSGTPTGTVQFLDNGTVFGSASLVGGQATLSFAALTLGAHTITASYLGDLNFRPLRFGGSATIVTVVPPDFTLNPGSALTVDMQQGGSASFVLHLTPTAGLYYQTVQFDVAGELPLFSSASFSPASIPVTAGPVDVTFTVATTRSASNSVPGGGAGGIALAVLLLPLAVTRKVWCARKIFSRIALASLVLIASLASSFGLGGCGTGYADSLYPLTITANSGGIVHSAKIVVHILHTPQ